MRGSDARAVVRPLGRCAAALAETAVATLVLGGALVLGHELREWREWYADPATLHRWAPTSRPAPPVPSPREARLP